MLTVNEFLELLDEVVDETLTEKILWDEKVRNFIQYGDGPK